MDSSDLTTQQAEQLLAKIWPMLPYFKRLREQMEQRSFPKDDELYRLVVRIHNDIHHLSVTLHYLSCPGGVGRPGADVRQQKRPSGGAGTEGP